MTSNPLDKGRDAVGRQAWAEACQWLAAADRESTLEPDDLVAFGMAAFLAGRDDDSADALGRAHREYLARGDWPRAAAAAFWLAFGLIDRGESAQAGGWVARAERVLDDHRCDSVERGYLLLPRALQAAGRRDFEAAHAAFARATELGTRFGDRDLVAMARHGQGRALVNLGRVPEGLALLDEAMAAVLTGELSPLIAGVVYCSVLSACSELFDLRRAREWTAALSRWCARQPDLVPFRGQCLIRRAEVLQLQGDWPDAVDEALRARDLLAGPIGRPGAGSAWYVLADLRRLRGELDQAEEAYRQASIAGRKPQPGLALLRLAQGQGEVAAAAIRRVLAEDADPRVRPIALAAGVEIFLAGGHVAEAGMAADELTAIAAGSAVPFLAALAAGATGAVLLDENRPREALARLRDALAGWQELDAPYHAARVRVLIGLACRALHDSDGYAMELEAGRELFRALGAKADLARLEELTRPSAAPVHGPLTGREQEVLRLVATGKTNRAIAEALAISEKTVARHVSNIFLKLGLSSRAAATAYAYEHGLNPPSA